MPCFPGQWMWWKHTWRGTGSTTKKELYAGWHFTTFSFSHTSRWNLFSEPIAVPKSAVYWEESPGSKVGEIKPGLFLSAPAAAAPRFHFPSALSHSHCSCCFSCCSLPLSSRCSLPRRGSRFMFPWGWGSFPVLSWHCWEEKAIALFHLLWFLFLPSAEPTSLLLGASPGLGDVPLCPAEELLSREPDLEALTCLGLKPDVSRGRRRAGMRVTESKDAIAGELTHAGHIFHPRSNLWLFITGQAVLHHPFEQIYRTVTVKKNPHIKKPLLWVNGSYVSFCTIPQAFHPAFQPTAATNIVRSLPAMLFAVAQRASWDSRKWKGFSSRNHQVSTPQRSVKECQSWRWFSHREGKLKHILVHVYYCSLFTSHEKHCFWFS